MADEEQKSNNRELAVPGDAEIAGHKVSIDELRINNSLFVPTHEIPLRKNDKITFIGAGLGPYNRAGFGLEKGGASFSTVFKSSDSSDAVFIFTVPNDIDRVKDGGFLWLKLLSQASPQFNIPLLRPAVYSAKEASDEEAGGNKEGQGEQGGQGAAGAGAQSNAIEEVLINPALAGIAGVVKQVLTPAPAAPKTPQSSGGVTETKAVKKEEAIDTEGAGAGEETIEESVSENVTGAATAASAQEVSRSATISQGSTTQISSEAVGGGSTVSTQGSQTIVSGGGTVNQGQNIQFQTQGRQTAAVSGGPQFQQTGTAAGQTAGVGANISGTASVSGSTSVSGTIGSQVSASATGQAAGQESVGSTVKVQAPAGVGQGAASQGGQAGEAQGGGAGGSVSGAGQAGGTVTAQAPPPPSGPSGVATAAGAGGSAQVSAPSGVSGAAAPSQTTAGQPSSSQVPSAQKTAADSAQAGISAPASVEKEQALAAGGAAPPVSPTGPIVQQPPPAAGQTISQGQTISPQAQQQAGLGIDGVKAPPIQPSAPTGAVPAALPNLPGTAAPLRLGWQPPAGTTLPNMDAMRRNAAALDNALKGATAKGGPKSAPAGRPSAAGRDKSPENKPGGPGVAPNIGRGEQPPSQEGGQNPEGTTAPEGAPGTAPQPEAPESAEQEPEGQTPPSAPPSQPPGAGGQGPPINPNAALPQPPGASDQEQSPGAKQALATATGNPLIRALANSQAASKIVGEAAAKATSQIWTWAAVAAYGSGFTIIGFYLGAIVMNVYWVFLYRRDEKLFPLKGWQKVVTILTDLIALGVPALLIILVLVVGCNFPLKIAGTYRATYIGAFIGDSCKAFDIDNLNTGISPLQSPVGGPTGVPATGSCQPTPTGDASVNNLIGSCFGQSNAFTASVIAFHESGGNPSIPSSVDKCQPGGQPVSFGLFQLNITVFKINGLNCPAAFDYPPGVSPREYDAKNHQCTVVDQNLYNSCVLAAETGSINIQTACQISKNGTNWFPWQADIKACNLNPTNP